MILVDFPEFNLKLARSLKKQGLRVIYYISPQIWAWRKYRIRTIRHYVDLVVSILPFERDWYASQGIDHVVNVRNPIVERVHSSTSKSEFCLRHDLRPENPIVALLPGSRSREVARILPNMLKAASRMTDTDPAIQFVIPLASGRTIAEVDAVQERLGSSGRNSPDRLVCIQNETYDALNAADAAAVTSGTATLEAGILGTPMAVVYKVPRFDYQLLKQFVDVPHIGLINLIAGERLAKELIQDEFTADVLADELLRLLEPKVNSEMREKLRWVTECLRKGNSTPHPGEVVVEFIRSKARLIE